MDMKKIPTGKKLMDALLTYRRPHEGPGEVEFCKRFVEPVAQHTLASETGVVHAWTTEILREDGTSSSVAFCAHTDSVHHRGDPEPRQKVMYDPERMEYFVEKDVLGADDAAGVYVLLEMMRANVPGLYVFFRGEERGGIGSGWVADNMPEVFYGISAAIQFDRRATHSIITHQFKGRTCSDAFATSLAEALDMGHELDDGGSFTDTANLADRVPECTNVSVGYYREHSKDETLDWGYLERLAQACIKTFSGDGPALAIERKPGDYDLRDLDFRWSGKIGGSATPHEDDRYFDPIGSSWAEELAYMTEDDVRDTVEWIDQVTLTNLLLDVREELRAWREIDE